MFHVKQSGSSKRLCTTSCCSRFSYLYPCQISPDSKSMHD